MEGLYGIIIQFTVGWGKSYSWIRNNGGVVCGAGGRELVESKGARKWRTAKRIRRG